MVQPHYLMQHENKAHVHELTAITVLDKAKAGSDVQSPCACFMQIVRQHFELWVTSTIHIPV